MNEPQESLDSQIRSQLDKDSIQEKEQPFAVDPNAQALERFDMWLAHLKRRHPMESEKKLREAAANYACLNRRERRKVFKLRNPQLPKLMRIPRGKR